MIACNACLAAALRADLPNLRRIGELSEELPQAWDTPRRWQIIREYYRIREPMIRACATRFDPYELGLERFLTPIEFQLWQDIRQMGLPFLLQYPVGRRFVDFGCPRYSVAVEADGAAYHTRERDARKTADLAKAGWMVFRIKGRDTYGDTGTRLMREIAHWVGVHIPEPQEEEA